MTRQHAHLPRREPRFSWRLAAGSAVAAALAYAWLVVVLGSRP